MHPIQYIFLLLPVGAIAVYVLASKIRRSKADAAQDLNNFVIRRPVSDFVSYGLFFMFAVIMIIFFFGNSASGVHPIELFVFSVILCVPLYFVIDCLTWQMHVTASELHLKRLFGGSKSIGINQITYAKLYENYKSGSYVKLFAGNVLFAKIPVKSTGYSLLAIRMEQAQVPLEIY